MIIPAIGQNITVNFDVESEDEDGVIARADAGTELTVVGYDSCMTTGTTPEEYLAEWGSIELRVEFDATIQNIWDRSGCSDYETVGGTWISVEPDSDLKIAE